MSIIEQLNRHKTDGSSEKNSDTSNEDDKLNRANAMAFMLHVIQKRRRSGRIHRRESQKEHAHERQYNYEKKRKEIVRGNIGTSALNIQAKTTNKQAIEQEYSDWGVDSRDSEQMMHMTKESFVAHEGEYNKKLSFEGVVHQYDRLFSYLEETKETTPNLESEYQKITNQKEKLSFISSLSLADRVKLFCGNHFDYENYDQFVNNYLQFYQDYIDGDSDKKFHLERHDIRKGLIMGALHSSMIGTPEHKAYERTIDILTSQSKDITSPILPPALKTRNEYYYDDWERYYAEEHDMADYGIYETEDDWSSMPKEESVSVAIKDWGALIDEYDAIQKSVKRSNPSLDRKNVELRAIDRAAHLFAKATDYYDPNKYLDGLSKPSFEEAVVWAQLGKDVQDRFRYIRSNSRYVDLSGMKRFIGKSGASKKYRRYQSELSSLDRRLTSIKASRDKHEEDIEEQLNEENRLEVEKQRDWLAKESARVNKKYDKIIGKTRSEERKEFYEQRRKNELQHIEQDASEQIAYFEHRTVDELIDDISSRIDIIRRKLIKHESLANKAIDLHLELRHRSRYGECLNWINDAPFSAIQQARMLECDGLSTDAIYEAVMSDMVRKAVLDPDQVDNGLEQIFKESANNRHYINTLSVMMGIIDGKICRYSNKLSFQELLSKSKTLDDRMQFRDEYYVPSLARAVRNGLGSIDNAIKYSWIIPEFLSSVSRREDAAKRFPFGGSEHAKYSWCSNNSFSYLTGDWGRQTIGKIIYTRLSAGVESTIHDATQWLSSFNLPETWRDIRIIKDQVRNPEAMRDSEVILYSAQDEQRFLASIIRAPQEMRSRLRLSHKRQNMSALFFSPENYFIYSELANIYNRPDCSIDMLKDCVKKGLGTFYHDNIDILSTKTAMWHTEISAFENATYTSLHRIAKMADPSYPIDERLGEIAARLKMYGQNRKAYIDDTTSWLTKHMTTPSHLLSKAWGERPFALSEGVEDNASSIVAWQKLTALDHFMDNHSDSLSRAGLSKEEIRTTYKPFVEELSRHYAAEEIVRALGEYKRISNPNKIMPAKVIALEKDGSTFTGEVLAYDDPRGMTIGPDTGCCMTIGGASESCIKSGYRDSNAGFFGLYDPSGNLMAQSYFYISPSRQDVLVVDNIEANNGRNTNRIIDLYQDYFTRYLEEQFTTNPDWKIRQVNVGTGYGEVAKAQVLRLKQTDIILNRSGIYSDAQEDQRLLLRLSDEQIQQARRRGDIAPALSETFKPQHIPVGMISALSIDHLPVIQSLEARIYPENMRQYDDDTIYDELNQLGADDYSFLIHSKIDAMREPVGYCIAYEAKSETDPNFDGTTVYVADFGIIPEARGGAIAMRGFRELLERLDARGIKKVEMDAREKTTYALLTSELMQRHLERKGWKVVEHDIDTDFGEGERTIMLSLERE